MAKIYSLQKGASFADEVLRIASHEKISTAGVEAIGGVDRLTIAYFSRREKRYEEHAYDEFFEVLGIRGNVTLKEGKPFLHAHGAFGRRDMSVIGGHLVSATVAPIMEVVIDPTRNFALRRYDEELGLNVIYRTTDRRPS